VPLNLFPQFCSLGSVPAQGFSMILLNLSACYAIPNICFGAPPSRFQLSVNYKSGTRGNTVD